MQEPNNPVTEDEVLSWFPVSRFFGKPEKSAATAKLTREIERRRHTLQIAKNPRHNLDAAARQLTVVTKSAKGLKSELAEFQRISGRHASGSEVTNLSLALNAFLIAAPGNAAGGQHKEQIIVAAKLGPLVAKCLERPNKAPPSLVSQDGPVVAVLTKAIQRIFGTGASATSLSDGLKAFRKRGTSPGG